MVIAGVLVAVVVLLLPINGNDVGSNRVDVSCGPALGAAMRWTGPGADPSDDATIRTGYDVGVTSSAWCEREAFSRLFPALPLTLVLVVTGAVLVAVTAWRRRQRPPPVPGAGG